MGPLQATPIAVSPPAYQLWSLLPKGLGIIPGVR